jgi:glutaredoxin
MLDLYILQTCPYCKKVLAFAEEKGISLNTIDIADSKNEETLITLGGKRQVPFLVDKDRNVQMYESADIIEYLKTVI